MFELKSLNWSDRVLFKKKIYIDGRDNLGWHVDVERSLVSRYIERNKLVKPTNNWRRSGLIYNLWWSNIYNTIPEYLELKKDKKSKIPKLLLTCSNFIDPEMPEFRLKEKLDGLSGLADGWVCPGTKQRRILDGIGLKTYYLPFSIDLDFFKRDDLPSVEDICLMFSIDYSLIRDKIVIGSFQRDSLGKDLNQPKWQKDPVFLAELLEGLPKDKVILLLAGPRRHYVLKECKSRNIPYIYVGKEMGSDDLSLNSLKINSMPYLYALADIYLITSKSEGGPKAAIEATAMKTFIMSTDVGVSGDFIDKEYVFKDKMEYRNKLHEIVIRFEEFEDEYNRIVGENYMKCIKLIKPENMQERFNSIIEEALSL